MKLKKLFLLVIGTILIFTSASKPGAVANEINKITENITQQVMSLLNHFSDEEDTENPKEIFSRAIGKYKEEFDSYIDITGLNVDFKESIILPEFDINYVPPTYGGIIYEYQLNLEASLITTQLNKYDDLRRDKIIKIETLPMHLNHSFFGQLYHYPTGSNNPVVHPYSPNHNPNI